MGDIFLQIFLLIVGFVLLMKGADWFVDGSSGIASRFGISELVIGLTLVALGTSAPEAAVSITSALKGSAGITIGNVVGSNILNVMLILGITGMITEVPVKKLTMQREIPFTAALTLLLAAFGYFAGRINFIMGLIFCGILALYLIYLLKMSGTDEYRSDISAGTPDDDNTQEAFSGEKGTGRLLLMTFIGLAGVILGSNLTVDSATEIARVFGMSERFIGLTIIAFGTSLPELVTSAAAAVKHKADIAIGNIIGSNIMNIAGIVGVTALITPVSFEQGFVADTLVAAAAVILLLAALVKTKSLRRGWGTVMVLCYAAYFVKITFL